MLRFYKDARWIKLILTFFLIQFSHLHAIDFNELITVKTGTSVEIRGFAYQTSLGDYILSPTPNLKTCCIGAQHQVDKQIYLQGGIKDTLSQKAILIRGTLHQRPEYDATDKMTKLYILTDWEAVTEQTSTPYFTIAVLCIALLICIFKNRINRILFRTSRSYR